MSKFGMFQILGAAITTIGIMFLITTGLSYTGILAIAPLGIGTAIVSLLMATNGFLILLFGVKNANAEAKNQAPARTASPQRS